MRRLRGSVLPVLKANGHTASTTVFGRPVNTGHQRSRGTLRISKEVVAMSNCLVCGDRTTRVAKEKAGRYTLCQACVERGYHFRKKSGIWCVTDNRNPNHLFSCNELLREKEVDQ